jgi:hypothetical protein
VAVIRSALTWSETRTQATSTLYQWFNTKAFARSGSNDPANAGKYDVRQPGVNNWDLALAKNFLIRTKSATCRSGGKHNAFSHTQYSTINTAARFDPTGAQTNALFGQVTATRAPLVTQGSLRFTF